MKTKSLLIVYGALVALCGCDDRPSFPHQSTRPGADRQLPASTRLPAAHPASGYDVSVVPENSTGGVMIGAVVPPAGGQQASKSKHDKAISDAKAEWDRERSGADAQAPQIPEAPANQ